MRVRFAASGLLAVLLAAGSAAQERYGSADIPPEEQELMRQAAEVVREGQVCDAALLSANGPDRLIVASVDYSGRRFCNTVIIVKRERDRSTLLQTISVWGMEDVDSSLVDLDLDGTVELVTRSDISMYEGAKCVATVPVVYQCSAGMCVDSTAKFDDFLSKELDRFSAYLADPSLNEDSASCFSMSRDKLLRMRGTDPRAGFQTALEWLESSDPAVRAKGVYVLGDINDAASRKRLQDLAGDTDESIARVARIQLMIRPAR
jgi:hypothetical protein